MSDDRDIDALPEVLRAHEAIEDAFYAKSFTDRLLVLDLSGGEVPDDIVEVLNKRDFYSAADVYEELDRDQPVGKASGANRRHFVDVRTRGSHQSYVVD